MSRYETPVVQLQDGFPRVSGDEPFADQGLSLDGLFSPRERG